MANNSLAGLNAEGPKYDLVGPRVDDDIRRAVARYGADAVKDAVKRQTKVRRGRKPTVDWPELNKVIEADARDWLEGKDPFGTRSNYSIAKAFADKQPGHSHPATMKRIERKLAQSRVWMTLVTAEHLSRDGYPYAANIRALEALCEKSPSKIWSTFLDYAKSSLADYETKTGDVAPNHLSITEVEKVSRNALLMMTTPNIKSGLFSLGQLKSQP